ncbi:MAG: DUF4976 domain-containing protein, partial [Lacipirellulaceae bacterium]
VPETMEGRSLLPLLHGKKPEWRSHFYYEHTYTPEDKKRLPIPRTEGIRTERWKYVRYPEQSPVFEQLFDLDADPLEQHNLIASKQWQEMADRLRRLCDAEAPRP